MDETVHTDHYSQLFWGNERDNLIEKLSEILLMPMGSKNAFVTSWIVCILTANIFESGPMPTPWNFLDRPPLLPSCKLG